LDQETYEEFIVPYRYALNLITSHLKNIQDELLMSSEIRNPIDSIYSRMKSLHSITKKCKKENYNLDPDDIEQIRQQMFDIAGIRITCIYRKDIQSIKGYIEKIPGVFILKVKDYVKNSKPNGYQSVHLVVSVEISTLTHGIMKVPVEIQIRTLAMQDWAQVEHRAWYKSQAKHLLNEGEQQALTQALRDAANLAEQLDALYDKILTMSGEE